MGFFRKMMELYHTNNGMKAAVSAEEAPPIPSGVLLLIPTVQ